MSCNKSLPNKRLRSDEDKVNNYLEGRREDYAKKISALQSIVHTVTRSLLKASKEETPNNLQSIKLLLDDTMNCCKFGAHDLEVYFDLMCDVMHGMRDDTEKVEDDNLLKTHILDCGKTISALLTIVSNSNTLLDDEVTHNERFLKDGTHASILLGDAQNTCRYCYDDLKVFCDLMDANMYNLQKLIKKQYNPKKG